MMEGDIIKPDVKGHKAKCPMCEVLYTVVEWRSEERLVRRYCSRCKDISEKLKNTEVDGKWIVRYVAEIVKNQLLTGQMSQD